MQSFNPKMHSFSRHALNLAETNNYKGYEPTSTRNNGNISRLAEYMFTVSALVIKKAASRRLQTQLALLSILFQSIHQCPQDHGLAGKFIHGHSRLAHSLRCFKRNASDILHAQGDFCCRTGLVLSCLDNVSSLQDRKSVV